MTKLTHRWNRDGERCLRCGAKDWMDNSECLSPEHQIEQLVEGLAKIAFMPEHDQDDAHRLRNMAKITLLRYSPEHGDVRPAGFDE